MNPSPIPVSDIDFYADAVIRNPFPVYAELRALGPVVYLAKNDLYALPRYQEVSEVLRQPLRYVSSRGVSPLQKVNDILVGSTLNSDPPIHDKTRAITSEPLLPGALQAIEPRLKTAADGLIETLCKRGHFDAVHDLARYLPLTIVAELVGLPDHAGPENMLKWASATFNLFSTENERTRQSFEDLKDLRQFLLDYGRPDQLRPGGWARRIFEVGPEHGLTDAQCAQLMRDYINPSLDTTISTTGQIIAFLAEHPDQWQMIREDASLIPNAVEEAVRMATPIRAFTRYVIKDSLLAGHQIPEGARVLVIYASANRDERKYPDPDRYDVTRAVHDHVGFGQGVHMCMGMHLARREIILLIEALRRQVDRFEITGTPGIAMNNTIRAYASLPVRVHLAEDRLEDVPVPSDHASSWMDVVVRKRSDAARDIVSLELTAANGALLPSYEAGAHIDVEVRSGLIRQYSLTGDPARKDRYRLGILRDPASRGGSSLIHDDFTPGKRLRIGRPRQLFPLVEAGHSILLAGGVGITPILAMAHALAARGASWEMHYCGRTMDRLAFLDELQKWGDSVHVHVDDGPDEQKLDLPALLCAPAPDKHVYVCGPAGFMDMVIGVATDLQWFDTHIHAERFGAEIDTEGDPFTVETAQSGLTFWVEPGETIAEKLLAHGVDVPMSCQSGVCGTCLTPVADGTPDHRDLVQTELEKAANDRITVCCSRSKTKKLVLNI